MLKKTLTLLTIFLIQASLSFGADINVLIIGSTDDAWDGASIGGASALQVYNPTGIRNELENILSGASLGTVNVTLEDRAAGPTYSYATHGGGGLATWFHTHYGTGTANRWANLRGENGTAWDYIVLIPDPYTLEYIPGYYTYGVAKIAEEVAKSANPAQIILLMPWPRAGSAYSLGHYKEVVYRTGRSGGGIVAPAGLAWAANGSPTGVAYPTADGAYIAAASIYSRIYSQSASESAYSYNDSMADTVHTTVGANVGAQQYTGKFNTPNPFLMLEDKRRKVFTSHKGSSTEGGFKNAAVRAMQSARVLSDDETYQSTYGLGKPLGDRNTPEDDGRGWLMTNPMPIAWNHGRNNWRYDDGKGYVVNENYWSLGIGFEYQWYSDANYAIGNMQEHDVKLSKQVYDLGQMPSGRVLPSRSIFANIYQYHPTIVQKPDGTHLSTGHHNGGGTFMYTMFSGRCPISKVDTQSNEVNWGSESGYLMAWQMGRCEVRAPGFRVLPSAADKLTLAPGTAETMTVEFLYPPQQDVTVAVSLSDTAAARLTPSTLVFTPSNYNIPQRVSIVGVQGGMADDAFNVQFSTTSADEIYNGLFDTWSYTTLGKEAAQPSVVELGTSSVTTPKNVPVTLKLINGYADANNSAVAGPFNGYVAWAGSTLVYYPDLDFVGTDFIAFAVTTGSVMEAGYITITVQDVVAPEITVSAYAVDPLAAEAGPETGAWVITRSGSTAAPLNVDFSLVGSATPNVDYTIDAASPVEIPIGSSSVTITLTPLADSVVNEIDEVANLILTDSASYSPSAGVATILITDEDLVADLDVTRVRPLSDSARIPEGKGMIFEVTPTLGGVPAPPNVVSVSWSKVSGPGAVSFETPNSFKTAATFDANGNYVLRATATDGTQTKSIDMDVEVGATMIGGLWLGMTGGYKNWTSPNPKSSLQTDIYTAVETSLIEAPLGTQVLTGRIFDLDGIFSFTEDIRGNVKIWIDGQLAFDGPQQEYAGGATNAVFTRTESGAITVAPGWHDIEIRKDNFYHGFAATSPGIGLDPDGGNNFSTLTDAASDATLFRVDSGDIGVDIDAGPDYKGVLADSSITLTATYFDDYMGAAPVTVTWELVSGPGGVQFSAPTSTITNATFDMAGYYVLRVVADDGHSKTFDTMAVTVLPNNLSAGEIAFSQAIISQLEGNTPGSITVTVTRRGGTLGAATVRYATANGTATVADNDYDHVSGSLSWNHGEGGSRTFNIPVHGDTTDEADETILLSLSSVTGAVLGATSTATATILNDDADTYTITYNGNGNTAGRVPPYQYKGHNLDIALAENSGLLVKNLYTFVGWNTKPDGTGISYASGAVYTGNADLALYAEWSAGITLLSEDFESPVVSGYLADSLPDTNQWVGSTEGFGSTSRGLVNKDGADFSDPDPNNHQGYASRYGNTGITTAEFAIGTLQNGVTYEITFIAVKDGNTAGTNISAQLIVFPREAARNDVRSLPSGASQLTAFTATAPTDGSIGSYSFTFTADPVVNAGDINRDLGLRFKGSGSSAIIDHVMITARPDSSINVVSVTTIDATASEPGDDTGQWTVSRTGDTSTAISIPFSFTGSASSADYTLSHTSPLNLAVGESSATITLIPVNDGDVEDSEIATLVLGEGTGYLVAVQTDSIQIDDNDIPPATYSLTYSADAGGSITGITSQTVNQGSAGSTVTAVAATGYTFDQWDDGNTSASRSDTPVADETYIALFTLNSYTVTYDGNGSNGGTVPSSQSKTHGIPVTVAATGTMTRSGQYFTGWNTSVDGSGTAYGAGSIYTTDAGVTLFAQWSTTIPTYTLDYVADAGGSLSGTVSQNLNLGDAGTTVTAVADTGYSFVQWSDGASTSSRTDVAVSDATFTAYFAADTYTITYNGNGNDGGVAPASQTKIHDINVTLTYITQDSITKTGYNFTGWNTSTDGSGTNYAAGSVYAANGNITLYARWNETVPTLFSEDFESPVVTGYAEKTLPDNGNWVGATQGYNSNRHGLINKDGGAFVNPDPANNQGYTFRYSNAGITTAAGVIGPVVGDDTVTISFDAVMDGTTSATKYNLEVIAYDAGAPRNDVRSVPAGCTLLGSLVGDTASDGSISTHTLPVYIDPTIFAADLGKDLGIRFKPGTGAVIDNVRVTGAYVRVTYGITYDGNGHTGGSVPVDSVEYFASDTATLAGNIGNLVKAGYTFSGWNTAADGSGIAYSADDVFLISENTTLYAQWTAGQQIADIALPAGISLFGYTGANPVDAQAAFQGLIDANQLSLVRWVNPADGQIKELYYTTFPSAGWINEIGNLTLGQGYVVKTPQACTLSLSGSKDTSSVTHNLPAGYSIIGFNKETPLDAQIAFQSLIDAGKLAVVRWVDPANGAIKELYYTSFPSPGWVNEIGNLSEGHGYIIKLSAPHSGFQLP